MPVAEVYAPVSQAFVDAFLNTSLDPMHSQEMRDMQHLHHLQADFNHALKLPYNPQDLLSRSFNPVTDRWHVEILRRNRDQEGLVNFKDELRENHRTDLMERYNAAESYGKFLIKDGALYSPEFPDLPLSAVLKRGVEYRKNLGSKEQEREAAEVTGWEFIQKELTNPRAEVGMTYLSFSPKSMLVDGVYKGRFVDKYTLAVNNTGDRYVKRARIAVNWDNNEYKNAALSLDPKYFDSYDGRPLDAWFLANPIKTNRDISPISGNGLSAEDFNYVYNDAVTKRLLSHYEDLIYAENVDWVEVALATNAIRNHTDDLKKGLQNGIRVKAYKDEFEGVKFQAYIYKKGMQKVETVGGGGCPPNKGINMGGLGGGSGMNMGFELFSNSVGKFGLGDEQEWFNCPKCNYQATGPIGNNPCPGCSLTQEQAAEEGYIICD